MTEGSTALYCITQLRIVFHWRTRPTPQLSHSFCSGRAKRPTVEAKVDGRSSSEVSSEINLASSSNAVEVYRGD